MSQLGQRHMKKISKEVKELYKQYGLNSETNFVPKNMINEGNLQRKLKSHFLEDKTTKWYLGRHFPWQTKGYTFS